MSKDVDKKNKSICFKVVEHILFQSLQYILAHCLLDSFKVFFIIIHCKQQNKKIKDKIK